MFGSVPGTFKNYRFAEIVSTAYTEVTGKEWCVVRKTIDTGETFYKPCEVDKLEVATKLNWIENNFIYNGILDDDMMRWVFEKAVESVYGKNNLYKIKQLL